MPQVVNLTVICMCYPPSWVITTLIQKVGTLGLHNIGKFDIRISFISAIYSQVHSYLDSDTIFVVLPLYTAKLDLK